MTKAVSLSCKLFYGATIITVNHKREIIRDGYILIEGDQITAVGKCPYPNALPARTREIDCRGKIIIPGLISSNLCFGGWQRIYHYTTGSVMRSGPSKLFSKAKMDSMQHG